MIQALGPLRQPSGLTEALRPSDPRALRPSELAAKTATRRSGRLASGAGSEPGWPVGPIVERPGRPGHVTADCRFEPVVKVVATAVA
jgi:hypothetical protein